MTDAIEPTTGGPYDSDLPDGCTGYYRDDADWGECLTHDPTRPCPVHDPNNCPLCGNRDGWCADKVACEARAREQMTEAERQIARVFLAPPPIAGDRPPDPMLDLIDKGIIDFVPDGAIVQGWLSETDGIHLRLTTRDGDTVTMPTVVRVTYEILPNHSRDGEAPS